MLAASKVKMSGSEKEANGTGHKKQQFCESKRHKTCN